MRVSSSAQGKLRVASIKSALIVELMKLKRAVIAGALLLAAGLVTGCSGINTSHSVSPATFLLPGLIQVTPPAETNEESAPAWTPVSQIARLD